MCSLNDFRLAVMTMRILLDALPKLACKPNPTVYMLRPEEVGKAQFSLATPTYTTVAYCIHISV